MAATLKRLYQGQPTAETTMYTTPANKNTLVKQVILANTTSGALTASVSCVPSGGTASAANRILAAFSVAANDTVTVDLFLILATGDFLSGIASATGLTISASGVEGV